MKVKVKSNEYVENYFVKNHDSGIIQLTINTKEKWLYYSVINSNEFYIGDNDCDGYYLKIEKSKLNMPQYYVLTSTQEKDQISFYWIPSELITTGRIRDKILKRRNND